MELLIAFFIAMTCLSGFFMVQSWTMRKETAALYEAKLWLVCDALMQNILLAEPLKETLLKLPPKANFQPILPEQKVEIAITPEMKMTFVYSLLAKCEGEKVTHQNELTRSYMLKIQFSHKDFKSHSSGKNKEVSYPLLVKYDTGKTGIEISEKAPSQK